jgi:hypothetical protein
MVGFVIIVLVLTIGNFVRRRIRKKSRAYVMSTDSEDCINYAQTIIQIE